MDSRVQRMNYHPMYKNVRNELINVRDLVLYGTRIVVPSSSRSEILEVLHSAHQGVTGMKARAR